MFKSKLLFLTFIFLIYRVKSCQPNYQLENIQTGMLNFQNTNKQLSLLEKVFTYNFFNQYLSTPQLAFAINNFQTKNLELTSFYISVLTKNISNVHFSVTNYQNWTMMTINFIITLRKDLYLDSLKTQIQNPLELIKIPIQTIISYTKAIARIFLNGFMFNTPLQKNQKQKFGVDLNFNSLTQKYLFITYSGTSTSEIRTIWLSYIIFSPQQAGFSSYGGRISKQNFKGIQNYDIHKNIYRSQYKLFGITGVQLKNQPIGLISSINAEFVGTLYLSTDIPSLTINYVILGQISSFRCACQDQSLKYAYQDACLTQCPQNSYIQTYADGSSSCLTCSEILNMKLNINKTQCECFQGYELNSQTLSCKIKNFNLNNNDSSLLQTPTISNLSKPLISIQPSIGLTPNISVSSLCVSENSYFNGFECYCKMGYKRFLNTCIKITQVPLSQQLRVSIPLQLLNNREIINICNLTNNQISINGICQCKTGYIRFQDGICYKDGSIKCGIGQYWNTSQCVCLTGYVRISSNYCQSTTISFNCSTNQINNGLGTCICLNEYFYVNGTCIKQKPCPLNSVRISNGSCQCNSNFFTINGQCSKCPLNQYWLQKQTKCIISCGQNTFYNQTSKKCQCLPTYGITTQNKCQYCFGLDRFVFQNYCVTCPLNQILNPTKSQCICKEGFYLLQNGQCSPKCGQLQQFDSYFSLCRCISILGRFKGVCQICPFNYYVNQLTQQCTSCRANQFYSDGKCICKPQFIPNQIGVCVSCGWISNSFLFQGRCASCAGQKIYNGLSCVCPQGTHSSGSKCVLTCKEDELIDDDGNCYNCPINQVVINKKCQCINSYIRIQGVCRLNCPIGSFEYAGICARCPTNQIFNRAISGCVCQPGYYLNTYNQCERFNLNLLTCSGGQFLDLNLGCISCSFTCQSCSSNLTCLKCKDNYSLINGTCYDFCGNGLLSASQQCDDKNIMNGDGCSSGCRVQSNFSCTGTPSLCKSTIQSIRCGNGLIESGEECDDSNINNGDGCSSLCRVEHLFQCFGQPSICKYDANYHVCANGYVEVTQQCDDKNFHIGDGCDQNCMIETGYQCQNSPSVCMKSGLSVGLKVYGDIKYNINNIFIVLQTNQKFKFSSEVEMQNFIKANYSIIQRPSTYCLQKQAPDLDLFDCLLIYSSGVPNKAFKVNFYYTYNSRMVNLTMDVDPLSFQIQKIRNLRRLYHQQNQVQNKPIIQPSIY